MSSSFISQAAHLLGALLVTLATSNALAQTTSPGRLARLNLVEGTVHFAPAGSNGWGPAEFNRPLASGDRLHTAPGARAELYSGSTALRTNGSAALEISELDDTTTRLSLTQGSLALRVRQLYPGETLEVNTPNLAFTATQPGEYRLDVDTQFGTTRVTVRSGNAMVYGENGASRSLGSQQQARFFDRLLGQEVVRPNLQRDAFDLWSAARDQAEDASPGGYWGTLPSPVYPQPRYVPYPIVVPFPVEIPRPFGQDHRRPPPDHRFPPALGQYPNDAFHRPQPPDGNRAPRPWGNGPTRIEPMVQPSPPAVWPQPAMPRPRPEMRMQDAPRNQAELEQRAQMQRQQQIDRERQQQELNRDQMQRQMQQQQMQQQQMQQQMRDQQNRQQQQQQPPQSQPPDRPRIEQARPMPRPQMVEPPQGSPEPRRRLLLPGQRPGDAPPP